jgi:hypothetical protein
VIDRLFERQNRQEKKKKKKKKKKHRHIAGKRWCLLLGTIGSLLSCTGLGFSTNLAMAIAFRFSSGLLNGNLGIFLLCLFFELCVCWLFKLI